MINLFDLNARHEAAFLWIGIFLIVALCAFSGFRGLTRSALQGLLDQQQLLFITGLLVCVSALTVFAVIAGRAVGLFSELPVFSASLWFIAALFPLAGRSVRTGSWYSALREHLMLCLSIPASTAAILSVATLPFWWEFVLTPILLTIVCTSGYESGRRFSSLIRIFLIAYTLILAIVAVNGPDGICGNSESLSSGTPAARMVIYRLPALFQASALGRQREV